MCDVNRKIIITGSHLSGQFELVQQLIKYKNIKLGNIYTNQKLCNSDQHGLRNYHYVENKKIEEIYNNNAFVFLTTLDFTKEMVYNGLTYEEFEKNNLFVLTPEEVIMLPRNIFGKKIKGEPSPEENHSVVFIWLDSTPTYRMTNYENQKILYDFQERETTECYDLKVLSEYMLSHGSYLYFQNIDEYMVSPIVKSIYEISDETLQMFLNNYN